MVRPYEKPELVAFASDGTQLALGAGKCETGSIYTEGVAGCVSGCIAYQTECKNGGWAVNAACNVGTSAKTKVYNQCCTGSKEYIQSQGPTCVTGYCAGKGGCSTGGSNTNVMNCTS